MTDSTEDAWTAVARPGKDLDASSFLRWPQQISNRQAKEGAARHVAAIAADGEIIGVGSGSASYLALRAIATRAHDLQLSVKIAAASYEIENAATGFGLPTTTLRESRPNWAVDGADEIDPDLRVLKGRGGALFREKLLWAMSPRIYVIAEAEKRVASLGSRFPMPIEVHPGGLSIVRDYLQRLPFVSDAAVRLAQGKDGPVITESGFLIIDAFMSEIPRGLHNDIKCLPGVLETGLFEGYDVRLVE